MRTILVLVITCLCHVFTHAQTTLTFDGVDDYTQTNYYNQLDLGTGNFALEAMVSNIDFTLSDTLTILSQENINSTQGIRWFITNNAIHIQIEGIAYSMPHTFTGCTHLAVVRDNGELLFYANSSLLGTQSIAMTATSSCTNCDLLMGKTVDDNNYFKGTLDEVRIWNTNRSGTDISSYETSCLDSTEMTSPSLVGYWNFEENAGQFANNLGSIAHYTRLGNTFYSDNDDPTWTTTSCVSSTCYANGLASFSLSDNDPKEADLVMLSNTSTNSSVVYWSINGDTTLSVDSLQYAFPLGMNIIQLAVTSASGLSARTVLLDVKRPKYPCGADEYRLWERLNNANYPITQKLLASARTATASGNKYYIPVIFHVIADNQDTLNAFPRSRIQAQLDTLNYHFAKDSTDIIFCLAQQLPSIYTTGIQSWADYGTLTTPGEPGITYTIDPQIIPIVDLEIYQPDRGIYRTLITGQLPFSAENYLNIYVVKSIILDSMTSTPSGVANIGPTLTAFDGIAIIYDAFVDGSLVPLGKTLVHEVGHWLGLEHVFGEDYICDTYLQLNPTADSSIANCTTPYSYGTSCPPNPTYYRGQNHMDYHTESCRTVFTRGQIDRMHYVLDNGRPYLHSELNLIATGVQQVGGCLDRPAISAVFEMEADEICADYSLCLEGANYDYDYWEWGASWDPLKNNGTPSPNMSTVVHYDTISGSNRPPKTFLSISEPGVWDIYLIVQHLDTTNGNIVSTTVRDTLQLIILDCSLNDERNRITAVFDSADWEVSAMSIVNLTSTPSDTLEGYMVAGTGFILNQNSVGAIIKTDLLGRIKWRKSISILNADVQLFDLVSDVDYLGQDCIALTGHVTRGATTELLFVIINRTGDILFEKSYQLNDGGTSLAFTTGLQVIQLSSSFNNQFAIVGLTGSGVTDTANKSGFIMGIDPSLGIQWSHSFQSTGLNPSADFDIAENVVEINANFGPGLVIGGNANRTSVPIASSGGFFSCITISGQTVTEQWRQNFETGGRNKGGMEMVAIAYENGRLFGTTYSQLRHGAFTMELDPNTGAIGVKTDATDFIPSEMIIDGNYCVLSGRRISTQTLSSVKVELPPIGSSTWSTANSISREYFDSEINSTWGGEFNFQEPLGKRQNIVPSSNGGYMIVAEKDIIPLHSNSIGLMFNKIDDLLVSACVSNDKFDLGFIVGGLFTSTLSDSIQLRVNIGTEVVSIDSLDRPCSRIGCETYATFTPPIFYKCPQDTLLLTTTNVLALGDYSYQWSPSIYLSSDTVFEPTTVTPIDQVYTLIITDNETGCQIAEAEFNVLVTDTSYSAETITKCIEDSILLRNADLNLFSSNYTYQWFPSTFLDNPTVLEPMCFATSPQTYTLVVTSNDPDCRVFVKQYNVNVNGSLIDTIIPCISNLNGYTQYPQLSQYSLDLNIVLNDLGITDTFGIWSDPTPHPFITLTPPYFDTTNKILNLNYIGVFNVLHYEYGSIGGCKNLLILRLGPDATITSQSNISICEGELIQFTSLITHSTWSNEWRIFYNPSGGTPVAVDLFPFSEDSASISYIFDHNISGGTQNYGVIHVVRNDSCPGDIFTSNFVYDAISVQVYKADGIIRIDTCTEILTLSTSSPSDTIQWYDATTGLAITGETTHNYSPTTSGSYYASVTTPQCDFISDTFTYSPLLPISSTATVSSNYNGADISCFGEADGAATVTISNGLSPSAYLWSNGDTLVTATDLTVGNYQVTVIDACMDTTIANVTLTEPTALTISVDTIIAASCSSIGDGSATVIGSGGTAPYTYLWSNGSNTATTNNLSAIPYTVTLTDANGCSASVSITGTAPNPIIATMTNVNTISCSGGNDGTATASVSGGTSPYTYLWSSGEVTNTAIALSGGFNSVTITDANNCTITGSVLLTQPLPVSTSINVINNITCSYTTDGSVQVNAAGGTNSYTYLWSNGQTNALVTGLSAGTYTVTVSDGNNCTIVDNITLTAPTASSITTTGTNVSCYGLSDGGISTTVIGTTTPYTYLWSNGSMNQNLVGLTASSYTVTVTDVNSCTLTASQTITEPIELTNTSTPNNPTCTYSTDASIQTSTTGGTPSYNYLWSNGQNTAIATGLSVGTHYVTITDANSCTIIDTISLTAPTQPTITTTGTNVSCYGLSDGGISTTVIGTTTPYTYLWSNGSMNQNLVGLTASSYTVTVTDVNSCTLTASQTITEPIELTNTSTPNNPTCTYSTDASIQISATGGTPSYNYLWSNGQNTVIATGLSVGTHYVTITDANSCTIIDTISLTAPTQPIITTTGTNISCNGLSDGGITTTVIGSTAPYTYLWSNGSTSTNITGLGTASYSLTVTDVNGCTLTVSQTITEPTTLTSTFNSNSITCANASSGSITNTVSGGTAPYTYLWSNGETSQDIVGLSDGIYCVTITDANNCTFVNCDTLAPAIDVSVDKSISSGNAQAGDIITYTITIENNCQSSTNFVVLDTLPIGLLLTDPNGFTYNSVDRTLNNIVPVAGGSSVSVSFMAQIIGDGRCISRLLIDNKAYVNAQGTSSPVFVDSVRLRVQELVDACDTSLMSITFDDAINAGVLLPMAGAVNATNTPQNVVVNGTWRLNGNYTFALGSIVTMEGGAEMIISAGAALTIDSSSFEGCNCLWHRILVETDGRIITRNTAELKDAQYAIQALDQSLLDISETSFLNNFIGIYVAPSKGNNIFFLQFLNNEFRSRDIKEPFAGIGETPAYTRGQDIIGISVPTGTGQPTRQQGLAGIYIWDIISLNLNTPQPSNSNLFRNLTSGIVAFQSNLSVNSCEFQSIVGDVSIYPTNLAFQGCGIHAQSDGGVHNLSVEGMIDVSTNPLSGTNTFTRCDVGISGLGVSMDIDACGLNNIQTAGIRSMSCFSDNISIKGSRMNRILRVGIELFNCDVNTPTIIASNEVDMANVNSAVPMFRAGISVVESGVNPNFLDITENKIISRNSQFGIVVNGHREGGIIRSNEVQMRGNYNVVDRAGISILNSSIALSCNDITGNNQVFNTSNTFGILGSISGGEWSCNTVDRMATGVFFEGFNDVVLQGTRFSRHKNGLQINSNSTIGTQDLNGNRWIGNLNPNTNPDALDLGNASQLIINPNNITFLPNNWQFNNLIIINPFGGGNYNCNSPQIICGSPIIPLASLTLPSISTRDLDLANNVFTTVSFPLNTQYSGKKKLFRKLLENPTLAQNSPNSNIQNFVNNYQNTCIAHFDGIKEQEKQALHLSFADSTQIDSLQSICESYLDSLNCLDSLLCRNYNNTIQNKRSNIANQLKNLSQQQKTLLSSIEINQQNDLLVVQNNNSVYVTNVLHEQLEQQVNEIYLQTLAQGSLEFSSTQLSTLQTIANNCPQEGGAAVHQARGILSIIQDVDVLDFNCNKKVKKAQIGKDVVQQELWNVILYPNPTKNELTIESNIELNTSTKIEIYNSLGQQVKVLNIKNKTINIDINVSTFIDGVYILKIEKEGNIISKPFVVSQ